VASTKGLLRSGCALLLLASVVGGGCGADGWSFESITGGPDPHATLVVVWLSDSPVDGAKSVWVTIDRVEAVGEEGVTLLSAERRRLDLLALVGGLRAEVGRAEVPAGLLSALRLTFATEAGAHSVLVGDVEQPLVLAPGAQVWDVPVAHDLPPGGTASFQVDLDARLSVTEAAGTWTLSPTGRAADSVSAAWLGGVVVGPSSLPLADVVVGAQQGGEEVASSRTGADGRFLVGPLAPGSYVLVATKPGWSVAASGSVSATAGATTGGTLLVLAPSVPGSVEGTTTAGEAGLVVRAYGSSGFLALAGVDPATGRFAFPALPPGDVRLETWRGATRLGPAAMLVVVSGGLHDVPLLP
jgi:hypothetical protein